MTALLSHTNSRLSRLAIAGLFIGQVAGLASMFQVFSVASATAQTKPANPSAAPSALDFKQCNWAIAKSSIQQPDPKMANQQTLLREGETMLAKVQQPAQLTVQAKPVITPEEVAIGSDFPIAAECWQH